MTTTPFASPVARPARQAGWQQIPALDGVRGLAALMVIVFHYYQAQPTPASSLVRRLYSLTSIGQTGVDLFFVLSGFLITGILLHARGTTHAWKNFYARRSLRIFPLYYLVLVLVAAAALIAGFGPRSLAPSWWYWLYLQNFPQTFAPNFPSEFPVLNPGHFWSLAVEEHFYLVWPAIVLALPLRLLPRTLLAFVAVSVVARGVFLHYGISPFGFTLTRLDALSVGALIAVVRFQPGRHDALRVAARWLLVLCPILLVPLFVLTSGRGVDAVQVVKFPIQAILFGALLVVVCDAAPGSIAHRVFANRFMRATGKYSYGLYVYHPFVLIQIATWLAKHPSWADPRFSLIGLALAVASVYVAALASWHLYEKHFLKLKRHFDYREPPGPPPGAAKGPVAAETPSLASALSAP